MVTKAQIIQAIQALPDDVSVDDVQDEIERLKFVELSETRVAAIDAGAEMIPHNVVRRRMGHLTMAHRIENDT